MTAAVAAAPPTPPMREAKSSVGVPPVVGCALGAASGTAGPAEIGSGSALASKTMVGDEAGLAAGAVFAADCGGAESTDCCGGADGVLPDCGVIAPSGTAGAVSAGAVTGAACCAPLCGCALPCWALRAPSRLHSVTAPSSATIPTPAASPSASDGPFFRATAGMTVRVARSTISAPCCSRGSASLAGSVR